MRLLEIIICIFWRDRPDEPTLQNTKWWARSFPDPFSPTTIISLSIRSSELYTRYTRYSRAHQTRSLQVCYDFESLQGCNIHEFIHSHTCDAHWYLFKEVYRLNDKQTKEISKERISTRGDGYTQKKRNRRKEKKNTRTTVSLQIQRHELLSISGTRWRILRLKKILPAAENTLFMLLR